ncbi:MAG TPA: hypothetical protein VGP93_15275, partial [Polyangiaceae bacterium]|nr:hypothetical protein [Polyangiaceae bacterium]
SISARGARRQVDMLELVRQNFYRRLAGDRELSPGEYQAALETISLSEQLAHRAKLEARALRQLAAYDRALGKPVRGGARLLCAAALQPHRALRWLVSA